MVWGGTISSDDFARRRSCYTKKQYASSIEAQNAIDLMRERHVTKNESIHWYACELCGWFHVGHSRGEEDYERSGVEVR